MRAAVWAANGMMLMVTALVAVACGVLVTRPDTFHNRTTAAGDFKSMRPDSVLTNTLSLGLTGGNERVW